VLAGLERLLPATCAWKGPMAAGSVSTLPAVSS
jgi:hypothetical protein